MSLTIESAPRVSDAERSARLDEAGRAWSDRITADTAKAALTYTVSGDGEGSVATHVIAGRHEFTIDEPAALAGDDAGASPVEYALAALISCQIVVYRLYAHTLGIRLDSLSIDAEGDLDVRGLFAIDESVRPGFSAVRLNVRITGPESDERYEELHRAVDAHCPVFDLFANATPVTTRITTN